ncbi:MAG: helix-turn-helix domain-containing protein [Pseudonocardiales bacterium]|nr:helix-turn-helix domain-containing protein [Pseudonocardiales bacterium]
MSLDPTLPVGRRIQLLRERRGLSRAVVAGLCGRSESWLKKIEQGTRQAVRLPMLLRLAEVLRLDDLTELTGQHLPLAVYGKPTHQAIPALEQVMTTYPLGSETEADVDRPPSVSELQSRLDDAHTLWRTSRYPRTEVGALLPSLLRETQQAVRVLDGSERRAAADVLAGTYQAAQRILAYQPVPELVFLAADRGMAAAQEADDPLAIAGSAWYLAHVFRDSGRLDQAERVVKDAAELVKPSLDDASSEYRAMWGSLQLARGLTAACDYDYDFGTAWHFWDIADEIAQSLGGDYWHPLNGFGPVDMQFYGVRIDVTLGRYGDAARRSETIDVDSVPSLSGRSRYFIELARCYLARRDDIAACHLLFRAYQESPEYVKNGRFGRGIVQELMERNHSAVKSEVRDLATKMGLPT